MSMAASFESRESARSKAPCSVCRKMTSRNGMREGMCSDCHAARFIRYSALAMAHALSYLSGGRGISRRRKERMSEILHDPLLSDPEAA